MGSETKSLLDLSAKELATFGVEVQPIGCDVSCERAVEEAAQATLDR